MRPTHPQVRLLWSAEPAADLAGCLVREEAARWWGVLEHEVRLVRLCTSCGSPSHGQPRLVPTPGTTATHVSISRSDGVTVVALCDAGPVGVDVELAEAAAFKGFSSVCLHPSERAATARERTVTWVRKESLLKATGHGLVVDPGRVRLTRPSEPPAVLEWTGPALPAATWLFDVVTIPGHVAAVTVLATSAPELDVRQAGQGAQADRARPASG